MITPIWVAAAVSVGDCDRDHLGDSVSSAFASPKSKHLDGPVLPHLDVGGLQVAVNDPGFVGGLQRLSDLLRYREASSTGIGP